MLNINTFHVKDDHVSNIHGYYSRIKLKLLCNYIKFLYISLKILILTSYGLFILFIDMAGKLGIGLIVIRPGRML